MGQRLALAFVLLALPSALLIAQTPNFPNPDSGARVDTPDDPFFDCDESDDEAPFRPGGGCDENFGQTNSSVFQEHSSLFSFGPDATQDVRYQAHAEDPSLVGQPQISGSSVDLAWKITTGDPRVVIAITDTGIDWGNTHLRRKIWLNRGELPMPEGGPNTADTLFGGYDVDGDGAFTVDDYANDSRVDVNYSETLSPGIPGVIDGQDVLAAFSDGTDDDDNGYVDDIVGWDHFEDDNNPSDTTSYSNARLHGTGRAVEAAEQTNDGAGEAGVCPQCLFMPLRIWDTFVVPGDNWAIATVFAADHGAQVEVTANGSLGNTPAAKAANKYAYDTGMALMHVSSDLNSSNHNYPTNYLESIFVNGCISDQHTLLGSEFGSGDQAAAAPDAGITTWFRASNLTQYGAHAHVCWEAITGSEATGHAGGAAGMIVSRGLEQADAIGGPLTANEIKQLLTKTAEDVLPENTGDPVSADFAQRGWDEHFGYGRVHLQRALQAIAPGTIPPEAVIESPPWWHLLDPEASDRVPVTGFARAARSAACTYVLEWAPGIEPANDSFTSLAQSTCTSATGSRQLGEIPLSGIADQLGAHTRDGSVPNGANGRPDINAHMFTVRLRVTDAEGNEGEDRKVYLALHDPSAHTGWPKFVDVGGNSSPVLYDLDGDGTLEIIEGDAGGKLCVYSHDGTLFSGFNSGQCWQMPPAFFHHPQAPGFVHGDIPAPSSGLRTPAIADLNNDFLPEIVLASFDGRIFVLDVDGSTALTLGVNPAFSTPARRDLINHPKRGFVASPSIADLDMDGIKDIIIPALDGYIYAWRGDTGAALPGFPFEVREDPAPENLAARGELIYPVALTDLNGDGQLDIVTGSSDIVGANNSEPPSPPSGASAGDAAAFFLANSAGATSRVYAFSVDFDSGVVSTLPGWPVSLSGILPDVLPFVGPQNGIAAGDLDGDGVDEIVASITSGDATVIQADGSFETLNSNGVVNRGDTSESTKILNLFEGVAVGEITGSPPLDIARYGLTLSGAVNLIAVGQNQPQDHVIQVWEGIDTEQYATGFPTAHDDFVLTSHPAIANVDGNAGNEVLAGSGLYLLQAYSGDGNPAEGFPKQTGGWMLAVPAIGDVDGDGFLNMVAGTREGWRFVWDLEAAANTANNSEWWTEAHDEHHTLRYGHDSRPPRKVQNLAYDTATQQLTFIAAGDDWGVGAASAYQIRTLDRPIETAADWAAAVDLPAIEDSTTIAGDPVSVDLAASDSNGYVAVVAVDDVGNRAGPVSIAVGEVSTPEELVEDGGRVVVGQQQTASGAAGETVDAGMFTLTSTRASAQTVRSVTVNVEGTSVSGLQILRDNTVIGSRMVNGSGAVTITLNSPQVIAAGESARFEVKATLADAGQAALLLPLNRAYAMTGTATIALPGVALLGLLPLLAARRRRWALLMMAVLWLAGCGGSSGSSSLGATPATGSASTTLSLTAIDGDSGQATMRYNGLPITLATVQAR